MFGKREPLYLNPDARPGYGKALSKAYTEWCEKHEDSTQEERKQAYADLAEQIKEKFPTWRELDK